MRPWSKNQISFAIFLAIVFQSGVLAYYAFSDSLIQMSGEPVRLALWKLCNRPDQVYYRPRMYTDISYIYHSELDNTGLEPDAYRYVYVRLSCDENMLCSKDGASMIQPESGRYIRGTFKNKLVKGDHPKMLGCFSYNDDEIVPEQAPAPTLSDDWSNPSATAPHPLVEPQEESTDGNAAEQKGYYYINYGIEQWNDPGGSYQALSGVVCNDDCALVVALTQDGRSIVVGLEHPN